jgi:hypothetical protein
LPRRVARAFVAAIARQEDVMKVVLRLACAVLLSAAVALVPASAASAAKVSWGGCEAELVGGQYLYTAVAKLRGTSGGCTGQTAVYVNATTRGGTLVGQGCYVWIWPQHPNCSILSGGWVQAARPNANYRSATALLCSGWAGCEYRSIDTH